MSEGKRLIIGDEELPVYGFVTGNAERDLVALREAGYIISDPISADGFHIGYLAIIWDIDNTVAEAILLSEVPRYDDDPSIDDDFPMSVEYDGLFGDSDFHNELTAQQEAEFEAEYFGREG